MARKMRTVSAPRAESNVLVIAVDPLKVARGHRTMPRGGTHRSGKHPGRSKAKRQWRRDQAEGRGDAA